MAEPPEPRKRPARPSQAARPSKARHPGGRPSQIDRALALRDAVEQAMDAEKTFKQKTVIRTSRARLAAMLVIAVPLLVFSIYSWVARPAFVWGPPTRPLPQAEADANVRMAMFLLGMRLDAYREAQGFYPASLDAIGEALPGVSYELVTDSIFELRAVVRQQPVIFRSDMTGEEYLRNTKDIIWRPRKTR